ncbi:hypothetical protein [Clostridium botulinum]|nr:hypothetical protein [Clostridium botulinum]MBD5589284.1 hypothetical protein [Clostridium botulinum]
MITKEMYLKGIRCKGICTSNCKDKSDCYQYTKVIKNDIEIRMHNNKAN